jgi:ribonuclease HI
MTARTTTLYSDGGVVQRNPSSLGGTWAWCATDQTGWRIIEQGGYLLAETGQVISNNQMEWCAAMHALEAMPDGWAGTLVTDSQNVIDRLRYARKRLREPAGQVLVPRNLPWPWYQRMVVALERLGDLELRHVKGHPSAADLKRGYTVDDRGARKYAVSDQQVWCDMRCQQESMRVRLRLTQLAWSTT